MKTKENECGFVCVTVAFSNPLNVYSFRLQARDADSIYLTSAAAYLICYWKFWSLDEDISASYSLLALTSSESSESDSTANSVHTWIRIWFASFLGRGSTDSKSRVLRGRGDVGEGGSCSCCFIARAHHGYFVPLSRVDLKTVFCVLSLSLSMKLSLECYLVLQYLLFYASIIPNSIGSANLGRWIRLATCQAPIRLSVYIYLLYATWIPLSYLLLLSRSFAVSCAQLRMLVSGSHRQFDSCSLLR